jgi:hypothetical protein
VKKSDIIADALGELDENTLTPPEPKQKEKTERLLPKMTALAACVLILITAIPIIRPLLIKDPNKNNPITNESDGELVYNCFRCVGEAPFKLPAFAYRDGFSVYQAYYADNFGLENFAPYVSSLEESGFDALHQSETSAYLLRRDCIVQLWYANETNQIIIAWVSKSAYAPKDALSEEDAAKLIYSKPRLQVGRLCPIDVTPKGFYEATGAQMFAVPYCSSDDLKPLSSYMEKFGQFRWFVCCIKDGVIHRTDLEKAAVSDVDGDGKNDVILMNDGGTSGVFTVCVDVITADNVYSGGTMMYPDVGFKNDNGKVIVRTVSEKFGEVIYDIIIKDGLPLLNRRGSSLPPVNDKKPEWTFTDKEQPQSNGDWTFITDNVIDESAAPYFPDLNGECTVTGHNSAVFPTATMLEDYQKRLEKEGFVNLKYGDENIYYKTGVIIKEGRCYGTGPSKYDSFKVTVFVDTPTEDKNAVTASLAIEIINKNCLADSRRKYGGGKYYDEPFTHDPVACAVDVTPKGFYELTGMQIFVCPWTPYPEMKLAYASVFFVNKNGAVKTEMEYDASYGNGGYKSIEMCLSVNGYYGGPVLCDADGDGARELILLTPYISSYISSGNNADKVNLTVYKTEVPAVLAKSKTMTFRAKNQRLFYAGGGTAVLNSYSTDKKTDVYFEIKVSGGEARLYDITGREADLNLIVEEQLYGGKQEKTADNEDVFTAGGLIDKKTTLTHDEMIDRRIFDDVKVFDANGKKRIIIHENDMQIRFLCEKNGEYVCEKNGKFGYNSLAMLYLTNAQDGKNAYAVSGFESNTDIYRYDLETGDVYSFISSKESVQKLYYRGGELYYITYSDKTYTLKCAVISDKTVYKICEISTGDSISFYGMTEDGVYVRIKDGIYFMSYDGEVKNITYINDINTYYCKEYGGDLYMFDTVSKRIIILDRDGSMKTAEINVKETFPAVKAANGGYYSESLNSLVIYNGAVVSCVKEDGGEYGIYLYYPDENRWVDISFDKDGGIHSYSFCVNGGKLYVYDRANPSNLMIYDGEKMTVIKDFFS